MKHLFRKAAFITALVMCVGFSGCGERSSSGTGGSSGGGSEASVNIAPDTSASFTLNVAVSDADAERNAMANIAKIFNQTYPNVTVNVITMGASIAQYIQNCYATNNIPDVFMCSQFDAVKFESMEVILNLQDYIDAEEANGTFDSSDYVEAYWELGQKDFGGDQIMIPRTMDRVVCHYNPSIFKAAGVDMSLVKNGWTWDDFKTVCATLRTYYDNTLGLSSPLADSQYSWEAMINPIFEAHGVQYFDGEGNVTVNSTETENALKFIKSLTDAKYFSGPTGGGAGFDSLKGCMAFDSQPLTYHMKRMQENLLPGQDISDYYDVVTMPVFAGNEKIGAGAAGYAVSADSAHKDYAWKFLKIIAEREGQNALADAGLTQPSVRKDMSAVSSENHWTVGFENYNLEAYTYKNGADGGDAWDCYTSFFMKVHHMACTDIISQALPSLVISYCNGKTFSEVVGTYKKSVENFVMLAEFS